ncbi:MAG: histidyl-tRNA synthetase [Francisellaceae bacterium]|nr:histidyl-tRNA synthetase [Francisellaceae bacterium]
MNKIIKAIRGMQDLTPDQTPAWQDLEKLWHNTIKQYAYSEIRMPLIESTTLFKRSIGEITDIVEKEMFTLSDKDENALALRPEGTASCVRLGIEHGLLYNQTQRFWYMGPMFRYERPQKGRFRQFHQIGVEAFGFSAPFIEIEHILLCIRFFKLLNIHSALTLQINNLGSLNARLNYRALLIDYFTLHFSQLDEDSKKRLKTNPLRILDSKNPDLKALILSAPKITDCLDAESSISFETFKTFLNNLNIAYEVNPCLVRGLDYYNGIVYEWVTDKLGAQATVCAGGRFDTLTESLNGPSTPACGFAMGIERLLLLQKELSIIKALSPIDVYLIYSGNNAALLAFEISVIIREQCPWIALSMNMGENSLKTQFKKADKSGATIAIVVGDEEVNNQTLSIKYLRENKPQASIKLTQLQAFLQFLNKGDSHDYAKP